MIEGNLQVGAGPSSSFAMRHWEKGSLPTPHILDSTWWFADETVAMLENEITRHGGVTVCLGTPSIALSAWQKGLREVLLIDRDSLLKQMLAQQGYTNVLTANLKRVCPLVSKADLVIADPPWYEADIQSFLNAAHVSARVGAEILISLPPLEVRDSIIEERGRLFKTVAQSGMELLEIQKGGTQYIRPPFEHNVDRVCGDQILSDWRVGDLARFRVLRAPLIGQDLIDHELTWDEVCFAHTRFRVLRRASWGQESPCLQAMGWHDDIFPSCSRRHPSRDKIEVWTSGNRAFLCENPGRFLEIAQALESDSLTALKQKMAWGNWNDSLEQQVAQQVLDVVQREESDYEAIRRLYV